MSLCYCCDGPLATDSPRMRITVDGRTLHYRDQGQVRPVYVCGDCYDNLLAHLSGQGIVVDQLTPEVGLARRAE